MPPIDLGSTLDDLLNEEPGGLAQRHAEALAAVIRRTANHETGAPTGLPDISADLDDDQRSVVYESSKTVRLLAPAGAGKTHCIANRILALRQQGVQQDRLLIVTFDRNSANELRGRCQDLLGADSPTISTLNARGYRLLKEHVWVGAGPSLLVEPYTIPQAMVRALMTELTRKRAEIRALIPTSLKRRYFLQLFSYLKNQLYSPRLAPGKDALNRLAAVLGPIRDTSAAPLFANTRGDPKATLLVLASLDWLFRGYEKQKEDQGYIDFDDQKLHAFEFLRDHDSARRVVQRLIDHLIVDECQDLNELDFQLIMLLANEASLMVVGDDDQSIYAFRGTSPRYIIDFEKLSGRTTRTIELRRNYRSPYNLVDHAAKLIQHNKYRVEKAPIAIRPERCDIKVYALDSPSLEASVVGAYIERCMARPQARHRDIAVLYRMNSQSLPLQLELVRRGIPYYCRSEDNILGQEYLPRVIAVLRYVADVREGKTPAVDDFMQLCRAYFRTLRGDDYSRLLQAARRSGPSYTAILEDPDLEDTKIAISNLPAAIRLLLTASSPLRVLNVLGTRFKGLRGMIGSLEEAVTDQLPLGELGDVAVQFASLREFTVFLEDAVKRATEQHTQDYDSDAVRLLTYFRSKGSQFETVILPSLNEGIIPHGKADVEDERRLFYVAVTRTKRYLWLSFVKRAINSKVNVSRFLGELELPQASWVS